MAGLFGLIYRNWQILVSTPSPPKVDAPLKFGILGASKIAPLAFIWPAKNHPEVVVQAVAARDKSKAAAYAKKNGIPQVFGSYQELLDDASIDAVYIPLPNGLHYEWALKALAKGKHVLLEKPSVSNLAEAEALFRSPLLLSQQQQPGSSNAPVLLEAVHSRFQPSWVAFGKLLDRPNIEHALVQFAVPGLIFTKDDIRFQYDLAGGAMMDLSGYHAMSLRYTFGAEPEECVQCDVQTMQPPWDTRCDHTFHNKWRFPNGGIGEAKGSLQTTLTGFTQPSIIVTHRETTVSGDDDDDNTAVPEGQEKTRVRRVVLKNFMLGAIWHRIDVEDQFTLRKTDASREVMKKWTKKSSKKAYTWKEAGLDGVKGEAYWMSYRHQLEEFVNHIKGRKGSGIWITGEDSISQSRMIEMAYKKSGLPIRPSVYTPPEGGPA